MVVVNSKEKTVLGIGLVTESRPDFFDFSEMTVVADIPICPHFYEALSAWSHKPIKNPLLTIVPASARPYKVVRAFHKSEVKRFATFVEDILSAVVPLQLESEAQFLDEYPTPMLVYVQDDLCGPKVYATLKKSLLFHEHADNVKDETATELVKRLLGKSMSTRDALRHINIASGDFENTSLWYMYKRLPGCMDRAGLAWSYEQEETRNFFHESSLPSSLTCIVKGFSESPFQLTSERLFEDDEESNMPATGIVYKITARSLCLEDALRVIIVQAPNCIGHSLSLWRIVNELSSFKQSMVNQTLDGEKQSIVAMIKRQLENVESASDKGKKAEYTVELMKMNLTECQDFIKNHPKYREIIIKKCYELKRLNGAEFPDVDAACNELLQSLHALFETDVPIKTLKATLKELKTVTAAVKVAHPREAATFKTAAWRKWAETTDRDTYETSVAFQLEFHRLERYIAGLKAML